MFTYQQQNLSNLISLGAEAIPCIQLSFSTFCEKNEPKFLSKQTILTNVVNWSELRWSYRILASIILTLLVEKRETGIAKTAVRTPGQPIGEWTPIVNCQQLKSKYCLPIRLLLIRFTDFNCFEVALCLPTKQWIVST